MQHKIKTRQVVAALHSSSGNPNTSRSGRRHFKLVLSWEPTIEVNRKLGPKSSSLFDVSNPHFKEHRGCYNRLISYPWKSRDKQSKEPRHSSSDFNLFGPLKQHLGGKPFADDDDVQHEVLLWMRQQPKEFYEAGIGALIKRWDKCINTGGD
ncbi:hypothetical protein AVEN_12239-1 [Araneus ventricosus]|uniref:Histone-lysine N-methyltransferase SETMAR n=1 Tax=Araneus ventricosus TaxID=182803 RepID=A0A4Y2T7J7_ARAVE|nr:hypothetical protein AVEN_12239-1 [Araneus ventricosus]